MIYDEMGTSIAGTANNLLGTSGFTDADGYASDKNSDVHTYSSVSSNNGPPHDEEISQVHLEESSTGDHHHMHPSGNTEALVDGTTMKANESYETTKFNAHLVRNPAYGTNIAIAPEIATEENVAYDHHVHRSITQV